MMPPEPEAAPHKPHKVRHRRLDLIIALSAIFMSLISLVVAIRHGHTMDRMADANA